MTDIQWAAIVSSFCIGGLIGSYLAGSLADSWGRKKFLLLNNLCFLLGIHALASRDYEDDGGNYQLIP
jgi:SP family facilitated glucose transporter-like MFS transporter 1